MFYQIGKEVAEILSVDRDRTYFVDRSGLRPPDGHDLLGDADGAAAHPNTESINLLRKRSY